MAGNLRCNSFPILSGMSRSSSYPHQKSTNTQSSWAAGCGCPKEQEMIADLFLFSSSTGKYVVLKDIRQWPVSSVLPTLEAWQFGVPIVCPTWVQWELIPNFWRRHFTYSCSILTDEISIRISSWTCLNYHGFIWIPLTDKLLYCWVANFSHHDSVILNNTIFM